MYYLYFFIGWFIGLFVSSFTLIQVLIVLFFGLPVTRELGSQGMIIKDNGIVKRYMISLTILPLVFMVVSYFVYVIIPQLFSGFIFGGVMTLFFGLGKVGKNSSNVSDYVEANEKYFNTEKDDIISILNK